MKKVRVALRAARAFSDQHDTWQVRPCGVGCEHIAIEALTDGETQAVAERKAVPWLSAGG